MLRSDHGLQWGPSLPDYATQIEQRLPWGVMIAPRALLDRLPGASAQTLLRNSRRLVTSFDFYATLHALIAPEESATGKVVPWAYDLLRAPVPSGRTCADARIPPHFCACANEASHHAPLFGMCHGDQAIENNGRYCPLRNRTVPMIGRLANGQLAGG